MAPATFVYPTHHRAVIWIAWKFSDRVDRRLSFRGEKIFMRFDGWLRARRSGEKCGLAFLEFQHLTLPPHVQTVQERLPEQGGAREATVNDDAVDPFQRERADRDLGEFDIVRRYDPGSGFYPGGTTVDAIKQSHAFRRILVDDDRRCPSVDQKPNAVAVDQTIDNIMTARVRIQLQLLRRDCGRCSNSWTWTLLQLRLLHWGL